MVIDITPITYISMTYRESKTHQLA